MRISDWSSDVCSSDLTTTSTIFADSFACSSTSLCRHAVTAGGLRSTRSISSRGWAMLAQRSPWAIGLCVIGAILLWAVITLFVALFGLGQIGPNIDLGTLPAWLWYYRGDLDRKSTRLN